MPDPGVVRDAELATVGTGDVVVTFTTDADVSVATRVGDRSTITSGPYHVVHVNGLEPATEYALVVDGAPADQYLPAAVTTLSVPPGPLLATIATANDVHFGETECGRLGTDDAEEPGPVFRAEPGDPPYPEVMNAAVVDEMTALDPDAIVVKGDLTARGTEGEYDAFLAAYGPLGERMRHVRGNHDAMLDPTMALNDAPFVVAVSGVTLAVLDTTRPGTDRGRLPAEQVGWLGEIAAATSGPVFAFGHHPMWNLDAAERNPTYFGINPDDSDRLAAAVRDHENIVGYFAGHTHRNRVRRYERIRNAPFVEIGCTKDYIGAWAEYRVHEGGYTQVVHRAASPAALEWTEKTRNMFAGLYRDYALGPLPWRCFTEQF